MRPATSQPHPIETGFALRVALLYAAIFATSGTQLPFLPVWLEAKGLDPTMIGIVLAAPMVVRVFAIPIATRFADRRDAVRGTIIVAAALATAGFVTVAWSASPIAILLTFALTSMASASITPLTETYAVRGLTARGRAYGPVRLWGSVAFIAGTFGTGFAADLIPAQHLIWMIVAGSAVCAVAAWSLLPLGPVAHATADTTAQPPQQSLLRNPAFIAVAASAGLIQASHAVYYGFSSLDWRVAGFDGTAIATLWSIGVVAEIVLFAVSGRLPAFLTPSVLLMIGAAGAALRWTVMAFDPPALLLPVLQTLHALSYGATHLGALFFIARHVPQAQAATAQGYLAIILGAVMAGAMGLSGWLYGAFGATAYAAMALTAVVGGAYGAVAQRAARRAAGDRA